MNIDEVINRGELRERLDGDMQLFIELTEIFLTDSLTILDEIENAISEKNFDKLTRSAHTLKGAVSNFSAPSAYEAALQLEIIGKNSDADHAPEALQRLRHEIDLTTEAMKLLAKEETL